MASLFRGASHASTYSKFRPSPPLVLVQYAMDYAKAKLGIDPPFRNAVDIGCGTGHSTLAFAPYFENITGFDVSEAQIDNAKTQRGAVNISYRVSSAEHIDVIDSSIDVVTCGQALHWFDLKKFFDETKRILVPNGVIAFYGYWIPTPRTEQKSKSKELHSLVNHHLHNDVLGKYWHSNRYSVLCKRYENIDVPFSDCTRASFINQSLSTVSDYIGYLSSWSAYQKLKSEDPAKAESVLTEIQDRIMELIDADGSPADTILTLFTDYFLVLGCKDGKETGNS